MLFRSIRQLLSIPISSIHSLESPRSMSQSDHSAQASSTIASAHKAPPSRMGCEIINQASYVKLSLWYIIFRICPYAKSEIEHIQKPVWAAINPALLLLHRAKVWKDLIGGHEKSRRSPSILDLDSTFNGFWIFGIGMWIFWIDFGLLPTSASCQLSPLVLAALIQTLWSLAASSPCPNPWTALIQRCTSPTWACQRTSRRMGPNRNKHELQM